MRALDPPAESYPPTPMQEPEAGHTSWVNPTYWSSVVAPGGIAAAAADHVPPDRVSLALLTVPLPGTYCPTATQRPTAWHATESRRVCVTTEDCFWGAGAPAGSPAHAACH